MRAHIMTLIQQLPRWAALTAVSFTLAACGGDGNNSSNSSSFGSSSSNSSSSVSLSSSVSSADTPSSASTSSTVTSSTTSSAQSSSSLSESSSSSVSSVALPALVLNEMRSDGGGYDYIEIYNASNTDYTFAANEWAVNDLKGFSEDKVPGVVIPAGTVITAHGFLLIAVDQTAAPFGAPTNTLVGGAGEFGLGRGDTALLTYKGDIIDEKGWVAGSHVNTFGRLPDGGEWHDQTEPLVATPGTINALPVVNPPATQSDIVINEVVSKGRADIDFDYVELYNKSSQPYVFAAGEWALSDSENTAMPIPGGTTIPGHGFLVLLPDVAVGASLPTNAPADAVLNSTGGFGIGKNETITLARSEVIIDSASYGNFHVNAYGRFPDGGELIALGDGTATQLYASPGLKNFMTPAMNLTVTTMNFSAFNNDEAILENSGFRVFGLNADLAKDVEPEYIAVAADSKTAWVSLQENNGIARINLDGTPAITHIFPLGFKDYGAAGNEIDPS
ncbi:MAG TPA: lamin tail domain-containing protein, partial [Cellvibrio sp.]